MGISYLTCLSHSSAFRASITPRLPVTATNRLAAGLLNQSHIALTTLCPEAEQRVPTPVPAVDPLLAGPMDTIRPMPLLSISAQARDRPVLYVRALRKPRYCDRPLPYDDPIGYTIG